MKKITFAIILIVVFLSALSFYPRGGQQTKNPIAFVFPQIAGTEMVPKMEYQKPGRSAELPTSKWVPQTFNNCGPATTSMLLQHFGFNVSQAETKAALRTSPNDTNVFTYEIKDYLKKKFDIEAKLLYNGDLNLIKTLIANGFYVLIEDWLHPNEDIGHDALIRGFDDTRGVLIADDPFTGVGVTYKYSDFDQGQWKPFNREYMPVYKKEKEGLLRAILGENWDEQKMYRKAIKINEIDTQKNPSDMYAWFNLGTSRYALGEYTEAKKAFDKSRSLGWPRRMLWYQIQPVQTYNKLGEYKTALELAKIGLVANDSFSELHLESAIAYKGLGDLPMAKLEAEKALQFAPNYEAAKKFLAPL